MIKAFFIACRTAKELTARASSHCRALARRYGDRVLQIECHGFEVILVTNSKEDPVADDGSLKVTLGALGDHPAAWDRFLKIAINQDGLEIENDYAGSMPVFYSQRNGLVLSSLEPCVYLATGTTLDDLSMENVYGFLRYSHFIWDETAWVHINQMLPDSRYRFALNGELLSASYLATVKATDLRIGLSDRQVAQELFELNRMLVGRSLSGADEIILPLSSGYDSRMIFAVLANDPQFSSKIRCFTYGSVGSVEVEGGRRLCKLKDVQWCHISLPCQFLKRHYLTEVADILGASLHMHGMYQIEFYEQIREKYGISATACLTSGFMTGIPAGQHSGVLQILGSSSRLTEAMNCFTQSTVWTDADLEKMPIFAGKRYIERSEERFRQAFHRFDGENHQKAVMFDVWTRQRNFISYYPRTLEWFSPVASPHMCSEYANFFMSLKKEHLWNRKAVELMFLQHYPDLAKVTSNSNGVVSLRSRLENYMFWLSDKFSRLGIQNLLPRRFRNAPFEFDIQAARNCGVDAFHPLLSAGSQVKQFLEPLGGTKLAQDLYRGTIEGNVQAYARAVTLQAIALNLNLPTNPVTVESGTT